MNVDAVILCGGRGQRMGGQDKGLVLLQNRPLVAWALAALQRQSHPVAQIYINANRNNMVYRQYGLPVVADHYRGFCGPLAGIHAAMKASTASYLLSIPCDVPELPADLVQKLLDACEENQYRAAFAQSAAGRAQPVICILSCRLLPQLEAYLDMGNAKVMSWLTEVGARPVLFDEDCFVNINTPADLTRV